jgi:hypothetical protein
MIIIVLSLAAGFMFGLPLGVLLCFWMGREFNPFR